MPPDQRPSRREQTLATKREIQAAAFRLFAESGYEATTVADVARAVGVAERTCFRHFPTKPDLVLWDGADYDLVERFAERPGHESVIDAFRSAYQAGQAELTADQRATEHQRGSLILAVPELRAAHLDHFAAGIQEFTAVVAQRTGRSPSENEVRALSGALIGILITSQLFPSDADRSSITDIEDALSWLQNGFGDIRL